MKYKQIITRIALTIPQTKLIISMEDRWLLRWANNPESDKRCWIEREGEEFTIPTPMVKALEEKGIIEQDNKVPIGTFHLVE